MGDREAAVPRARAQLAGSFRHVIAGHSRCKGQRRVRSRSDRSLLLPRSLDTASVLGHSSTGQFRTELSTGTVSDRGFRCR